MPQTRWHIGEIKVFGDNKVKADVKKLSKLNKYLFGDNNADFAAHTDLYDDEEWLDRQRVTDVFSLKTEMSLLHYACCLLTAITEQRSSRWRVWNQC